MSQQILTLTERVANVRYFNTTNFQTMYELAIILVNMV